MEAQLRKHPYRHLLPLIPTLSLRDLHQLHSHFIKSGLSLLPFLSTKLLAAAALLDVSYASTLLHLLHPPPLFAFNSLLRGHSLSSSSSSSSHTHHSLSHSSSLLNSLRSLGLSPDPFSFISALKSSARARSLPFGLQLHASSLKSPHYPFPNLRNALIHLYCTCGDTASASHVFDEMPQSADAVSWSTLMNGYSHLVSRTDRVAELFGGMRRCGVWINPTAVVCLLSGASVASICQGEALHGYCIRSGLCVEMNVATAIAAMYVRFESLEDARMVFDEARRRDVVLYNCMIDGYAKVGYLEECLSLLRLMKGEMVKTNSATLVGLLAACASSGALAIGRRVYEIAKEENLEMDASLGTAVLDMYMKCGCIDEAVEVFDQMRNRDVAAWTAMIMGLGIHGRARDALRMFQEMEEEGVMPNDVTFLAVLNACSHGGMVDKGKRFFERMVMEYGMSPSIKHYGCIIDLLGRAGLLEEAYELIRNLPLEGDGRAWRALLAACRVHGDVRIGKLAQQALVALGDEHPADSILLSSTYAISGEWADGVRTRDSEEVGAMMRIKKEAGHSSIEICGQTRQCDNLT